jgi:hypothetical protein
MWDGSTVPVFLVTGKGHSVMDVMVIHNQRLALPNSVTLGALLVAW